jgi:hypothetical protein
MESLCRGDLFKEPITRQPVEEAIEALCSGDGARKLSAQSFSTMTRLLLKVEPCLAKERGLCILVVGYLEASGILHLTFYRSP